MTNREIYDAALALLAEEQYEDCGDYEARAPYLLAAFVNECREVGGFRRAAADEGDVMLDLDGEFPLSKRLASAAAFYLAALLVESEDEGLSDRLFAHYAESVSSLTQQNCSGELIGIRDVYGFDA
jgi:hypothetical protein